MKPQQGPQPRRRCETHLSGGNGARELLGIARLRIHQVVILDADVERPFAEALGNKCWVGVRPLIEY